MYLIESCWEMLNTVTTAKVGFVSYEKIPIFAELKKILLLIQVQIVFSELHISADLIYLFWLVPKEGDRKTDPRCFV